MHAILAVGDDQLVNYFSVTQSRSSLAEIFLSFAVTNNSEKGPVGSDICIMMTFFASDLQPNDGEAEWAHCITANHQGALSNIVISKLHQVCGLPSNHNGTSRD